MNLRDGVAMNITIQMLKDASENAAKRNRLRDAHVLDDMQRSIKRYGKLTHRQAEYAQSLITANSAEAILKEAELEAQWSYELENNQELREKGKVIAKYYIKSGYYRDVATDTLQYLGSLDSSPPKRKAFMRMIENKYADKVWESHWRAPKWKVGDLVTIRKSYKGELPWIDGVAQWTYQVELPSYHDLSYMIIQVDCKPIDQAYTYSKTAGGTRYYKLLPVGKTQTIDVIECNLKKLLKKQVS